VTNSAVAIGEPTVQSRRKVVMTMNMARPVVIQMCLLTVLCAAMFPAVTATSYEQADELYNTTRLGYNKHLIPVKNQTDAISVNISLNVVSLNDYDEVRGFISITGFLTVTWIDEIISWKPGDFGGRQYVMMPQNDIWRPALYIVRAVNVFSEFGNESFRIRVEYMGETMWMPGGIMKSTCSADVSFYPYDIQTCDITFAAWGYAPTEVQLISTLAFVTQTYFEENGEWKLINTSTSVITYSYSSFITFSFKLERRPNFFIVNTLLPLVLLGSLNVLVFLLPAASGERMSFAITTLLSYTVFMTMLSDTMPQTAEPMSFLSYYIMLMMYHSTFIAMATIAVLRLYHKEDTKPVPEKIVTLINAMR
jgi:hypothetical protein